MEPITLALIVGGIYLATKKKATPQAAAQTVSEVEQLSQAIMTGGVSIANQMAGKLSAQMVAMGLVPGGVGHPPDHDGRTSTVYVTIGSPRPGWVTQADLDSLSAAWDMIQGSIFRGNKDGKFDHDEAMEVVNLAIAMANKLLDMAKAKAAAEGVAPAPVSNPFVTAAPTASTSTLSPQANLLISNLQAGLAQATAKRDETAAIVTSLINEMNQARADLVTMQNQLSTMSPTITVQDAYGRLVQKDNPDFYDLAAKIGQTTSREGILEAQLIPYNQSILSQLDAYVAQIKAKIAELQGLPS